MTTLMTNNIVNVYRHKFDNVCRLEILNVKAIAKLPAFFTLEPDFIQAGSVTLQNIENFVDVLWVIIWNNQNLRL